MPSMYTVYKCESKTSDKQRGRSHYSNDGEKTLCGIIIAEGWYIVDNTLLVKPNALSASKGILIQKDSNHEA